MIQVFYCSNTRGYTNIPSCRGELVFDSPRLQEGIFVYTLVKLYNTANLTCKLHFDAYLSVLVNAFINLRFFCVWFVAVACVFAVGMSVLASIVCYVDFIVVFSSLQRCGSRTEEQSSGGMKGIC